MANELVQKQQTFAAFLSNYKNRIAASLPQTVQKYLTPERMLSITMQATQRTPELLTCHPLSVINAVVYLAQLGLEPRPRQAYIIPYGKEAVPVIDYRGLVDLARRSRMVMDVGAGAVYESDEFDYSLGSKPFLHHKPTVFIIDGNTGKRMPLEEKDRGKLIAVWCQPFYTDGKPATPAILSVLDIDRIRAKSRAGKNGPWVTDYPQMAVKTAVRQGMNLMPQSGDYLAAEDLEEAVEAGPLPLLLKGDVSDLIPEADAGTNGGLKQAGNGLTDRVRKATTSTGAQSSQTEKSGGPEKTLAPIPWKTDEERSDVIYVLRDRLKAATPDTATQEYRMWAEKHGLTAADGYDPMGFTEETGIAAYRNLLAIVETAEAMAKQPA